MNSILIVEDSPVIREPLQATLTAAGYEVRTTANGDQAIAMIEGQQPDLLVLDINLPGADGLTVLKHVRSNNLTKDMPVLVLSGVAEKERVIAALKLRISAYLLKSRFSLKDMLSHVREILPSPKTELVTEASTQLTLDAAGQSNTHVSSNFGASVRQDVTASAPLSAGPVEDAMDALKSLKPVLPRSEIVQRLEECAELKGLSPAVSQVLRLTGTDHCSIEQVAKAISQDHAIALKVLKLANSAVYTRGEPVDSVQLAVSRIGLGQIRQTVLNLSVIDQFNTHGSSEHINLGQFWEHAIAVGMIAAELAHALELDTDTAFTMGLLHDVGRMFLADQFPDVYDKVLETAAQLGLPVETVEARMLLYSHADVMDRVLHSWKFPKQLINPIVFHHLSAGNIRRSAPRQIAEVGMLALANRLAHALMLGSSGNESIYPTHDICQMLNIKADIVDAVRGIARDETDKLKFALLATSSTANWPQLRAVHREAIGAPFRPLFISDHAEYDAYRIFCEELADDESGEGPNVGVIHLTSQRERVPVTAAYHAAEEAAGAGRLPLIVLSPAGKVLPERSLLEGRPNEVIATPLVIHRFVEIAKSLLAARKLEVVPA